MQPGKITFRENPEDIKAQLYLFHLLRTSNIFYKVKCFRKETRALFYGMIEYYLFL